MKSSIGAPTNRPGVGPYKDVRKAKPKLAKHLSISLSESHQWDIVTSAGVQQKNLAKLPKSKVAKEKRNPRVYWIILDQEVLDALEGLLRACWTNADGGLLESNPKDWATNHGENQQSCLLEPSGTVAAGSVIGHRGKLLWIVGGFNGEWVTEGGDGVETEESHSHGNLLLAHDNDEGSNLPWMRGATCDGVPPGSNEV